MFIKKNTLNKKDKETFNYYQKITMFHRWLVNILLTLSWISFLSIMTFLIFFDMMNSIKMWIFYPFWISFALTIFLTFCTSCWYFYLCTYRTIMIKKFQTNDQTHFIFVVFIVYFVTKWLAFGWWLAKKYNYKKELKHLKKDLRHQT